MSRPALPRGYVLIVEDDPVSAESLSDILSHVGLRSQIVGSGEEAVEFLGRGPAPCAILLDLTLPGMDGWEFRRRQRQDPSVASVPVVVITGSTVSVQQALSLDAEEYFTKPYDASWLVKTVQRYCG